MQAAFTDARAGKISLEDLRSSILEQLQIEKLAPQPAKSIAPP